MKRPSRRPARPALSSVVGVLLAVVLTACGVHVASPPPSEPTPDSAEQLRRDAEADAGSIGLLAQWALDDVPDLAEPVRAELTRIAAASQEHADALGGPYRSGLPCPSDGGETPADQGNCGPADGSSPTGATLGADESTLPGGTQTPSVTATPMTTVADVVTTLTNAANRNRGAANAADDGLLARLYASIGAAQYVGAIRLAALAGIPGPEPVAPVIPSPDAANTSPFASPTTPTASGSTASPTGTASPAIPALPPEVAPTGLTAADFATIVVAEDAARYACEVFAARTDADVRERLFALALQHGARAQAWALLGDIASTGQDPRRVAYDLPRDVTASDIVATITTGLGNNYAAVITTTAAGTRAILVNLLIDATTTRDAWGAPPETFPGLTTGG
jgi:hypothetical protein